MRRIPIALAALIAGFASAGESEPIQARICVQLIEVPHPVLTELLAGAEKNGSVLHDRALAFSKDGKAKLVDTAMVVSGNGRRAMIESIAEWIYPTEYNPTCVGLFGPPPQDTKSRRRPLRPELLYYAYETRNVGTTLEIEPTLSEDGQIIDLRFVPEWVRLDRLDTVMEHHDKWGEASLRMPVFETWRTNTAVTLMAGKFELVSVITPKPQQPAPAVTRKLLVFVRADVIRAGR